MYYEQRNIKISRIWIENQKFRISTAQNNDDLVRSMSRLGLINPLLVLPENDMFIILSGFRRIEAAQALGWTKIRASVLPPDTPKTDCVRLSISDNSFQRTLNLIEISRALALLNDVFANPETIMEEAQWLGLPNGIKYLKKIEPLCRMPEAVQKGILSDSIALSTAWQLSKMPENEAIAFGEIFHGLNCSLNKQREIITLVTEISILENKSICTVLSESPVNEILSDADIDKNTRTRRLRSTLRKRRYPNIAATEKAFWGGIEKLGFSERFRLTPPQDFEGDTYRLTIDFKTIRELKEHQKKLNEVIASPELEKILS